MFALFIAALACGVTVSDAETIPVVPAAKAATEAADVFKGEVLPLDDVVKEHKGALDRDAAKASLVIKCEDGKVYSLIKDDGSRKFFLDKRLLRRPMQLTAVKLPGSQLLLVKRVQSVVNGKLHDVDYWCETCQLSYSEPGICKCCGQETELRELPVEPTKAAPAPKPKGALPRDPAS
jgi:hypothetical protein